MTLRFTKNTTTEIIVALDLPTAKNASALQEQIGDICKYYKIGLELFAAGEGAQLSHKILAQDMAVLIDLKLLDIPATVGKATAKLADMGASALTVHAHRAALSAAVANAGAMDIFAVTLLTSTSAQELHDSGYAGSPEQYVVAKAKLAHDIGCQGVVCSAHEASAVRETLGDQLTIITPGIRALAAPRDDQARTATIAEASQMGANFVVVGRTILNSASPRQSLLELRDQLST